jgi:hypothetical protein
MLSDKQIKCIGIRISEMHWPLLEVLVAVNTGGSAGIVYMFVSLSRSPMF